MRRYLRGFVERADDSDTGLIKVVAATEGRKGDGIDLKMANADLARFKANPVIMYGHNYWGRESLPIGRAESVDIDGTRLLEEIRFDANDDFATTVERKLRGGFLNAVSIGFDAHDIDAHGVPARWELFETSVVPLPMDPDALKEDRSGSTLALARMLEQARAGKVLSSKNQTLVEDAIAALSALLESATTKDDEDDDERSARSAPKLAAARRRLTVSGHTL